MENVLKMVKSQGKVGKKSGNFETENEWQPCDIFLNKHVHCWYSLEAPL